MADISDTVASASNKLHPKTRHNRWMSPSFDSGLASIIIPTFNREALIGETLESAVAQTYRPIEVVVVDDGSTDNTRHLIHRWHEKAECLDRVAVRYFRQKNSGVGSARNLGLIESRGEFIQFLDSDDILHPRKLELQIACLQKYPQSGYAFSDMARLDDPKKWTDISLDHAKLIDSAEYYCSPNILTMVGVYRRHTCYNAGPWWEAVNLGEDEEYGFRALISTEKTVRLPGNLCAFRDHAGPRLTDVQKHQRGLTHELRAYRRMAEIAVQRGRIDDPRLLTPLAQRITCVVVGALELGLTDLAAEAIGACRELPVKAGRRVRLSVYQILNHLPVGAFPRIWNAWLKLRRLLVENPKRAA
jgi:hypothetical protein